MTWWANKVGAPAQRQAPQRPPVAPPQGGYPVAPPTQYQQQAPPQEQQEFAPNTTDPTKVSDVLPIWQWQGNERGGLGESRKVGNCPSCNSPRFFSRANGAGVLNHNTGQTYYPQPECADCGYPREQGSLGVASSTVGASLPARQGAAPAPPGAIGQMGR